MTKLLLSVFILTIIAKSCTKEPPYPRGESVIKIISRESKKAHNVEDCGFYMLPIVWAPICIGAYTIEAYKLEFMICYNSELCLETSGKILGKCIKSIVDYNDCYYKEVLCGNPMLKYDEFKPLRYANDDCKKIENEDDDQK